MPVDKRQKNRVWAVVDDDGYACDNCDHAILAVLMDLRDELQKINARLHCAETLSIPRLLRQIETNTKRRRRRKAVRS